MDAPPPRRTLFQPGRVASASQVVPPPVVQPTAPAVVHRVDAGRGDSAQGQEEELPVLSPVPLANGGGAPAASDGPNAVSSSLDRLGSGAPPLATPQSAASSTPGRLPSFFDSAVRPTRTVLRVSGASSSGGGAPAGRPPSSSAATHAGIEAADRMRRLDPSMPYHVVIRGCVNGSCLVDTYAHAVRLTTPPWFSGDAFAASFASEAEAEAFRRRNNVPPDVPVSGPGKAAADKDDDDNRAAEEKSKKKASKEEEQDDAVERGARRVARGTLIAADFGFVKYTLAAVTAVAPEGYIFGPRPKKASRSEEEQRRAAAAPAASTIAAVKSEVRTPAGRPLLAAYAFSSMCEDTAFEQQICNARVISTRPPFAAGHEAERAALEGVISALYREAERDRRCQLSLRDLSLRLHSERLRVDDAALDACDAPRDMTVVIEHLPFVRRLRVDLFFWAASGFDPTKVPRQGGRIEPLPPANLDAYKTLWSLLEDRRRRILQFVKLAAQNIAWASEGPPERIGKPTASRAAVVRRASSRSPPRIQKLATDEDGLTTAADDRHRLAEADEWLACAAKVATYIRSFLVPEYVLDIAADAFFFQPVTAADDDASRERRRAAVAEARKQLNKIAIEMTSVRGIHGVDPYSTPQPDEDDVDDDAAARGDDEATTTEEQGDLRVCRALALRRIDAEIEANGFDVDDVVAARLSARFF